LERGSVEQLEIHLKDQNTSMSELERSCVNNGGFVLFQVNEVYLDRQGFTLPKVGKIQWRKLNFSYDTPESKRKNINEMMDVIKNKIAPVNCNE
jgi:hypothetical protein